MGLKDIFDKSMPRNSISMKGTSIKLILSRLPIPNLKTTNAIVKTMKNTNKLTIILSNASKFDIPANIAEEKNRHKNRFIKNAGFDFLIFSAAKSPSDNNALKRTKNKIKAKKMQGKEKYPNLEKNTTISLPLIKPEPITVPIMARTTKKLFFINITY